MVAPPPTTAFISNEAHLSILRIGSSNTPVTSTSGGIVVAGMAGQKSFFNKPKQSTLLQKDQYQGNMSALINAVRSGDMAAAKLAMLAVRALRSVSAVPITVAYSGPAAVTTSSSQTSSAASTQRQADFQALIEAVNSGDSQAAQTALAKLQSDAPSSHRGGGAGAVQPATAPTAGTAPTTGTAPMANGGGHNGR